MTTLPARLLVHQVVVKAYKGSGAYGPVFHPPVTVQARVSLKRQLVVSNTGTDVLSEATVLFPPSVVCPVGSQVTFPGETTPRTTLTYAVKVGARVAHHVEVTTK